MSLPVCNVNTGLALCSASLMDIPNKPNRVERLVDGIHRGCLMLDSSPTFKRSCPALLLYFSSPERYPLDA